MSTFLPPMEEQSWLLDALADLCAARGSQCLLESPILEPNNRWFPDPFTPDIRGVHKLALRLLLYAGLSSFRPRVVTYINPEVELSSPARPGFPPGWRHDGAAAFFAGFDAEECLFGVNERYLEDPDQLVGMMCHEVSHAWRCHHGLRVEDRDTEELLTDVSTVYLGFGILTVNSAYQYRSGRLAGTLSIMTWSHARGGYLTPEAMSFLLAVQAVVRRLRRRQMARIRNQLEPNQAASFKVATEHLAKHENLGGRLGVQYLGQNPPVTSWVPAPLPERLSEPRLDPTKPREEPGVVRFNAGRATFRVHKDQATTLGLAGLLVGCFSALAVFVSDSRASDWDLIPIPIGGLVGLIIARWTPSDRCSDGACRARLSPNQRECPGCGGTIQGTTPGNWRQRSE